MNDPMQGEFSLERLLRLFTSAPNAFWRHDVDVSLATAVKMARFAEVAGVKSTFYLAPRSDFYNLFSREGVAAVEAILNAGHGVGLHCHHREDDPWDVASTVDADRELVAAGYPYASWRAVSFHMPQLGVLWQDFEDFDNAYASEWEGRYLADSRRAFGADKESRVGENMQINLHPEHWFS